MHLLITRTLLVFALGATPALAAPRELRVPLTDGKVKLFELSAAIDPAGALGLTLDGELNLRSLQGSLFVAGLNAALGDGCQVAVTDDHAVVRVDPERLPQNADDAKRATRTFTATVAPDATAAQLRTYGLLLPATFDPARPVVVLVHGLDSDRAKWFALADLLAADGRQVAWFSYPSDQPIADSATSFAQHFGAFRSAFPAARANVVAHSMGSLVTRAYVESEAYAGGIDRLILIGPPNHGSRWAKYRFALELQEHYGLWRHDANWRPTWMITDGLGEAGRDLTPTSAFLNDLNGRPRRAGVRYTIVAGDRHPAYRAAGNAVSSVARALPDRAERWWGLRHTVKGMDALARRVREKPCESDGPVSIESTRLAGVDDVVVLHADHNALFQPMGKNEPAAWAVIRERLRQ